MATTTCTKPKKPKRKDFKGLLGTNILSGYSRALRRYNRGIRDYNTCIEKLSKFESGYVDPAFGTAEEIVGDVLSEAGDIIGGVLGVDDAAKVEVVLDTGEDGGPDADGDAWAMDGTTLALGGAGLLGVLALAGAWAMS